MLVLVGGAHQAHALQRGGDAVGDLGDVAAREVAGDDMLVAGAVGPLGVRLEPYGPTSLEEAREYFAEQMRALREGGADAFILKQFDMSVLKTKLKQVLNRKPRKREAPLATESALSIDFPMLGKF